MITKDQFKQINENTILKAKKIYEYFIKTKNKKIKMQANDFFIENLLDNYNE